MITLQAIQEALGRSLPGLIAHDQMMSYTRPTVAEARLKNPSPKESSVLMLLFERHEQWHTLLIERPSNQGAHSGQLAFPGGKLEANETHIEAALRETFEEVGVPQHQLQIVGRLSELYIPPSHFVVRPHVALVQGEFEWIKNVDEVVRTIEVPLSHFLRPEAIDYHSVPLPGQDIYIRVPGFDINGHVLWGATAMMIQEFRHLFGYVDAGLSQS